MDAARLVTFALRRQTSCLPFHLIHAHKLSAVRMCTNYRTATYTFPRREHILTTRWRLSGASHLSTARPTPAQSFKPVSEIHTDSRIDISMRGPRLLLSRCSNMILWTASRYHFRLHFHHPTIYFYQLLTIKDDCSQLIQNSKQQEIQQHVRCVRYMLKYTKNVDKKKKYAKRNSHIASSSKLTYAKLHFSILHFLHNLTGDLVKFHS